LDQDTSRIKGNVERIYNEFREQRIDILLGTQIIAKGMDFPHVTLVGIISADTALNLPDFRAAERTFSLLIQASGRGGRRTIPADTVLQTYYPNHYSVKLASYFDYKKFYGQEIKWREQLKYPPFTSLINITLRGKDNIKVKESAVTAAEYIEKYIDKGYNEIIGPFQSAIPKKYNNYRWQIVIKEGKKSGNTAYRADKRDWLIKLKNFNLNRSIKMVIDIDPVNML